MTPAPPIQYPTPHSSPPMRSEKLLRDALLKDERERQQLSTPVAHGRRHSHVPTSSYAGEDHTRGSFLFRPTMSNPRSPSPSPSSFSQGKGLERHRDSSPVGRMSVYGGDVEGHNAHHQAQRRQSQQQHQQSPTPHQYYTGRDSPSPSPDRSNGTYSLLRQGQAEPLQMTPHEQILRTRLEKVLTTSDGWTTRGGDQNQARDEQGGWPCGSATPSSGGSMASSFITTSSSASTSNSSHSQPQSSYPHSIRRNNTFPTSLPAPVPLPALSGFDNSTRSKSKFASTKLMPPSPALLREAGGDFRLPTPPPTPPLVGDIYAHSQPPQPPQSSSPYSTTKPFNARKASTQCRAMEGYVSFASVEGLGEPPLVGDEFDGDGFGDGDGRKGGKGAAFLSSGMWSTALGWKKFLGGGGVQAPQAQGVVI